jgi:hypothetical protein
LKAFGNPNENSADALARALIAIDEHHGGDSRDDPYDVIEIFGTKDLPSPELASELAFRSGVVTHSGFRALK